MRAGRQDSGPGVLVKPWISCGGSGELCGQRLAGRNRVTDAVRLATE